MIAPVPSRFNRLGSELVPQRGMGYVYLGCAWILACAVVITVLLN